MKRLVPALAILAVGGVLAGCGETHGTGSAGSATPATSSSESGYHNMESLSAGIKEKVEERLQRAADEPGDKPETVSNVTCVSTGKLTAECHISYSGSVPEEATEVTISEDGSTFITH
jgi:hypothetical protein